MRSWGPIVLCAVLFTLLAGLGARADFRTHDEPPFLHYGVLHLRGGAPRNQRFNSKLPVTALHAVPVVVVEELTGTTAIAAEQGNFAMAEWPLPWGRAVGIALGAALVVLIGGAARSLAGPRAGFAAALLAALEPNLLAHLHLVTADGGATVATFLLVLATLRFARTREARDAALLGGALGLVLLCKFMLVVFVGLALLAVVVARAFSWRAAGIALLAALLVVNAGFAFRGVPGRLPFPPRSHKASLAEAVIGQAPLPLPASYLEGLDWTAGDEEKGAGFGNLYVLGKLDPGKRGWSYYYLVVFLLKLPLPLLVLATLGFAWNRGPAWLVLRVYALGWFLFLSLSNKAQIGLRHALPVVPILVVEGAAAYARLERRRPWLARALVAWTALSLVSFAPDFIPYTNELVLSRLHAYDLVADSNLDWGQARQAALEFLKAHPDVRFEPDEPVHGKVLVGVNALLGVSEDPAKFAWLRGRAPVAAVRHSYLLFEVP